MGQAHRVQAPDVLYHAASRGVDRQMIFGVVDGDRFVFVALLAATVRRYGWNLHAYCVMGNHFHLVLDTPYSNIGDGMRYLKSSYALWFNALRGREGHLFERRYFAAQLDLVHAIFGGGEDATRGYARSVAELPVSSGRVLPQRWDTSAVTTSPGRRSRGT